jgi:ATP-dependent Clp protease adapter protein ClpS
MMPDKEDSPKESAHRRGYATSGPLCSVHIHNDDVRPMESVVRILAAVFAVPIPNIDHIMHTAHITGKAHVRTLPGDEARSQLASRSSRPTSGAIC